MAKLDETIISWSNTTTLESREFRCGHCANSVASDKGFSSSQIGTRVKGGVIPGKKGLIYICHKCTRPNFVDYDGEQTPLSLPGATVSHVTNADVSLLYEESRRCIQAGAFTAAVMCLRKLLMVVAIDQGAKTNLKFIEYVDWLFGERLLPVKAKEWVDKIRRDANDATHEVPPASHESAELLLKCGEMLLKIVYEFPASIQPNTSG